MPGLEVYVIGGLFDRDWKRFRIERVWRVGPLRFVTLGWWLVRHHPATWKGDGDEQA